MIFVTILGFTCLPQHFELVANLFEEDKKLVSVDKFMKSFRPRVQIIFNILINISANLLCFILYRLRMTPGQKKKLSMNT